MPPAVSFVILTWNSERTIGRCLASIRDTCHAENLDYRVHLIDNGSRDTTCTLVESLASGGMPIEAIWLGRNRGTTITRNRALRAIESDLVCVLDSDASLISGSIRDIAAALDRDRTIGILAPKLIESSGAVQTSARRFPTLFAKMARIPGIVLRRPLPDYGRYPGFPFDAPTPVDTAISACWFFRRDLLDRIGLLDERIFYAPEDVDYCLRVWKAGLKVVYYPAFSVLHETQQITHKRFLSTIAASHLLGLFYYFLKHRYIKNPSAGAGR